MAYATVDDVQGRMLTEMSQAQREICSNLLDDAGVIIDACRTDADDANKKIVSCNMVVRAMSNLSTDVPVGATQGSMSALGYSQQWTMSSGTTGELYLSKLDKKLLGYGSRLGAHSPVEDMRCKND